MYMCHSMGPARAYEVEMEGTTGGGRVTLFAVCHIDKSEWDKDHVAFRHQARRPSGVPRLALRPHPVGGERRRWLLVGVRNDDRVVPRTTLLHTYSAMVTTH